jgi:nucleoside-diphosphate-sugar epimerase
MRAKNGESKVLGGRIVLSARQREGLPVVVAHLSTVWGPGSTSWLGLFRSIISGQFRLIGAGTNFHHIADVSDVVEGLRLCAYTKRIEGRTFILSGSEAVQLRRLVEMIGKEVGATRFSDAFPGRSAPCVQGARQDGRRLDRTQTASCRPSCYVPR